MGDIKKIALFGFLSLISLVGVINLFPTSAYAYRVDHESSSNSTPFTIPNGSYTLNFNVNWSTDDYPQYSRQGRIELINSGGMVVGSIRAGVEKSDIISISTSLGSFSNTSIDSDGNHGKIVKYAILDRMAAEGYLESTWNITGVTPGNYILKFYSYESFEMIHPGNKSGDSVWTATTSRGGFVPLPNLTASAPIPSTATAGVEQTYTSTISNIGNAPTGASFYNFFQTATLNTGGGTTVVDLIPTPLLLTNLLNGQSRVITSPPLTFTDTTAGKYAIRACADHRDRNDLNTNGAIAESSELNNNCSPWTTVTVTAMSRPDLTAGPVSPTTVTAGSDQTYTATISNIGTAPTGASFPYFFQIADQVGGGGKITNYASSTMSALSNIPGSNMALAILPQIRFSAGNTPFIRVCADKSSARGGGVITESNNITPPNPPGGQVPPGTGEMNNCGPWTTITITTVVTPVSLPDLTIIGGVTPTSILLTTPTTPTVFHSTIKNQGAVSTQTISYVFTPTFANGYLEVSVINGAKTNFSMTDVRVVSNSNSTNLITSFKQGSPYSYNTLTTSANNITSAIESSGNIGGAVSNPISLIPGQPYTLTYTYTPNPTNPGTAPDIRLVSGPEGRGNFTSPQNSGLNIVAQTGTFPYFFQKTTSVDANGQSTGTVTNLTSPVSKTTTAALAADATLDASSPTVSLSPGTYYLRACADKSSAAGGGVINESNEGNNCGGSWTEVTVACVSGTTWNESSKICVTNPAPVATLNVNSKVDSQSVTGVSITGTSGFGGTTNYIKTSNSAISTVLTALAISGKNFDNWSGDCSGPNPCNVIVNPGWTKTVTANYTTPVISPTAAIEMWLNNDPTKASARVYLGRTATVNLSQNDKTQYTSCAAYLDISTPQANQLDIDPTDLKNASPGDIKLLLSKDDLLTVGTHKFTMSCSKGNASVSGTVKSDGSKTELQIQVIDLNFEEN